MAKTRGAKSSSPSSRLRVPRETPVQGSIPEPPQPLVVPPPVEDAPLSPPLRRYETRRPPTTLGSPSKPPSSLTISPSHHRHESRFPPKMTPEVVIGIPWSSPPIEGNLDCVARIFLSSYSIGLLSVHDYTPGPGSYCHPLHHRRMPWYSGSQTHSKGPAHSLRGSTLRGLSSLDSSFSSNIVYIHPRGIHTPVSVRKELPPNMFFIDALLRHNIFPLQHWVISEGFFFGPHHLIMAALLYFEEKVHRKKSRERMLFHYSSPNCYARFWSTWGTHQSLGLSIDVFVERYSLSKNGRV
ncbi:hypothetical protein AAG906_022332 [Vitis piasezkii]